MVVHEISLPKLLDYTRPLMKRCVLTSWKSMLVHERPLVAMEIHGRFCLGRQPVLRGHSILVLFAQFAWTGGRMGSHVMSNMMNTHIVSNLLHGWSEKFMTGKEEKTEKRMGNSKEALQAPN